MRIAVRLLVIMLLGMIIFGCTSGRSKEEQAALLDNDKKLALKFLQGVQEGDKNKVYEAANLTTEIVGQHREKLMRPAQSKQTEQQKKDSEHALRISGNIDFIIAKIKVMLPKSAAFQITQTAMKDQPDGVRRTDHSVKVTYSVKEEAITDKTGKTVKEMVLPFLQISRSVDGRWINDFSFDSKDFEKIAGKEFEVISYF